MKKVTKSPLVMDVLNIQGVQRSLERLADLLGKIQKALGEYLERERSSFPRYEDNTKAEPTERGNMLCFSSASSKVKLIDLFFFSTKVLLCGRRGPA